MEEDSDASGTKEVSVHELADDGEGESVTRAQ